MSVLLKSYVDASGELVYFVENGDNDVLAASDSTLTRVQGGDITVSDDLTTIEGNPLTDNLQAQITANDGDIATLQSDVVQEVSDRTAGDAALQTQIDGNDTDISALQAEQTVQDGLISTNAADIAQEILDRQAGDTALQGQITTNSGDITTLQSDLATETANRIAGDSALSGQIASNDTDIATLQTDKADISALGATAFSNSYNDLDDLPVITSEVFNAALAAGSVNPDGTTLSAFRSTVVRLAVGTYRVTFDTPQGDANYPVILTTGDNMGTDDYMFEYRNVTPASFDVFISEQDNGTGPGILVDSPWSYFIPLTSGAFIGLTDHDELQGLGDDDHPQYALSDGSRGNFATTAQGALADSAVQPGDLGTVATSNDYNDLDNLPTIPPAVTNTSDLVNDGATGADVYVEAGDVTTLLTPINTSISDIEADILALQTAAGGYFSDGGEAGGAARSLGNTDAFDISLLTNGVARITIQADGDIGFGVTSPIARFHAQGGVPNQEVFVVRGVAGQSESYFEVRASDNTDLFAVRSNGEADFGLNKGINLGDPTALNDAVPFKLLDAVKVRSTATGNLNTGVATFNNFTTTDELGSTLGQFSFATNGITPNFTGLVRIDFNIELISFSPRPVVGFRWSHNGSVGPWCRHTYIRDTSGHEESSANFSTVIPVVAGQPIQIQHDNFAAGGTVSSPANGAEFVIQRIR